MLLCCILPELPLVTVILCKFMLCIILYHPDMEMLLLARLWLHLSLAIVLGFFSANLSSPQVFFQTALMHGLQPQTCFVIVISPHLINFTTSHPRQASKVISGSIFADRYLHWKSLHVVHVTELQCIIIASPYLFTTAVLLLAFCIVTLLDLHKWDHFTYLMVPVLMNAVKE